MNNRLSNLIVAAFVAAVVAFGFSKYATKPSTSSAAAVTASSSLEKIVASGVIRCGYISYPPNLIVDPATKKVSGIFPEILEKAAGNLGLKVEWTEEVAWGTMIEGLQTGRYDLVGSPVWPTGQRLRVADFTAPIDFDGVGVYVRADDSRFDTNIAGFDDAKIRIATMDGEAAASIAQEDFPKAQTVSLPQISDLTQLMLTVADRKADVTFVDSIIAQQFIDKNPGKIKAVRSGLPIRLYANEMMLKLSDGSFRRALDGAISDLQNNGAVDRIIRKYEPFPGAYYRIARPLQEFQGK